MKSFPRPALVQFMPFVLLYANTLFSVAMAESIPIQADGFEHIQFKKIIASQYTYHDGVLQIDVDQSASFLMLPFDEVKKIDRVSFEWRSDGVPKVDNAYHEEQRKGDDAVFKLGLLLKSDDAIINPFLPSWMKRVEKLLKHPSEKMINLVAASKHLPGEQWPNPYNKRVTTIAVASVDSDQGWMRASYQFDEPVEIVGLWLMADGDNSHSRFTTYVKSINIE